MNKKKIVLFDLDGTLITHDTLKLLVLFLFKRNTFKILFKIPFLVLISFQHFLYKNLDNTHTKSKFLIKLLEGYNKKEIESFSQKFAKYIFLRFKNISVYKKLLKAKKFKSEIYIVTASADFYCKFIAKLLAVKLISTRVNLKKKNLGKIIGKNCYGVEKKKRVLKEIKKFKNKYSIFYTDSSSDISLMKICSESLFV
ncbi:HAD-IB family phosphatase [Candidatus Pelagibacter sp. HIMB1493]|uniref:HAD-IB family phosphatase n=1 Tax=Candidatus Pelagibacter sp. HIMB1493 TaxID=3413334 RepID=UPI003F866645